MSSSSSSSSPVSSSSYSLAPANYVRQCVRLAEPDSRTVELINGGALALYVWLPFDIVNRYAAMIPAYGPDTLVINYTDYMGQSASFTRNVTLWMSDSGYVLLSADQGTQFLIAGVNGAFFDANAIAINDRNVAGGAPALKPCANACRYDSPALLPNQVRPQVWIRDGVLMVSGNGGGGASTEIPIIDPTANP